jgi:hypothetical protein
MPKKNFYNNAKYDKDHATFEQIIFLSNGKQFIGYSKKMGYDEKADKVALLKNWILRMFKAGYLNPENIGTQKEIDQIDYFLNDHIKQPILILKYDHYEVVHPEWATNNFKIIQFLDTYYLYIKNQDYHKITRLFDYSKGEKMNKLDLNVQRFMSEKALTNWCKSELEKNTYTPQELRSYWKQYNHRYFNNQKDSLI